jgi:hypothetical protein
MDRQSFYRNFFPPECTGLPLSGKPGKLAMISLFVDKIKPTGDWAAVRRLAILAQNFKIYLGEGIIKSYTIRY